MLFPHYTRWANDPDIRLQVAIILENSETCAEASRKLGHIPNGNENKIFYSIAEEYGLEHILDRRGLIGYHAVNFFNNEFTSTRP